MHTINTDRPAINVSPEKIREASWELWDWLDEGISQESPIEWFDEIVEKIIKVIHQDKVDAK